MYILTEYLDRAMAQAVYEKLDNGTYGGRIPPCPGVVAFGTSLSHCAEDLRSTLEDWVLLGMKLAHALPVIAGIDLNREPVHEPVDTLISDATSSADCECSVSTGRWQAPDTPS